MRSPSKTRGRLAGHTLRNEGAPFLTAEHGGLVRVGNHSSVAGMGRALCSCGDVSPLLDSAGARRRWHREHKASKATHPTTQEETP